MTAADARDLIDRLYTKVRAADLSIVDLFAPDAVVVARGMRAEGRDEIRSFYERQFTVVAAQPHIEEFVVEPPRVVTLMRASTADRGDIRTLNLYSVADGKVRSLEVFYEFLSSASR